MAIGCDMSLRGAGGDKQYSEGVIMQLLYMLLTVVAVGVLLHTCGPKYVTAEGWEFADKWDYTCDNGFTYRVQSGRGGTYPIFNKEGKPLSCKNI